MPSSTSVTTCLGAEVDAGQYREVLPELLEIVGQNPFHEELRGTLMLALYRADQQAAALSSYAQVRKLLANELGVNPGLHLQSLYLRILNADPKLLLERDAQHYQLTTLSGDNSQSNESPAEARGVSSSAQLPRPLSSFVGRHNQLVKARSYVKAEHANSVIVMAIAGAAGVGKSAFAIRLAHELAPMYPDGQFHLNLRGFEPSGQPLEAAQALRTLIDSLGIDSSQLPLSLDPLSAHYRGHLAGRKVLLLLDNARDAAQVISLLPGNPGSLVIVTSRNQLTSLVTHHEAKVITLDTLSAEEADELLWRRLGEDRMAAEPEARRRIAERCAYLPLALAIISARAASHPEFPLSTLAEELSEIGGRVEQLSLETDQTASNLRAVFSLSLEGLSSAAQELFRMLAHHPGPEASTESLASLAGQPVDTVRRLLNELTQSHLLTESMPGRYAFHDLLRAYAMELAESRVGNQNVPRMRILDHYLQSSCNASRALDPHVSALTLSPPMLGVSPQTFSGQRAALAWFGSEHQILLRCIDQALADRHDQQAWQIAVSAIHYLDRRGHHEDLRATHEKARQAAQRLGDTAAEALALRGLAKSHAMLGDWGTARSFAEQTVELLSNHPDAAVRAESHRQLAWVAHEQSDSATALKHTQKALDLHLQGDNASLIAKSLNSLAYCKISLFQYSIAISHCQEALRLLHGLHDQSGEADVLDTLGLALQHAGKNQDAVDIYESSVDLATRAGSAVWGIADTLLRLGQSYNLLGRVDESRRAWVRALEMLESITHSNAERLRCHLDELLSEIPPQRSLGLAGRYKQVGRVSLRCVFGGFAQ
ncbi:tetratricopeptide repeat protein (plasmid) [Streptomyces globisporus]|nr:tetratricopeptide repeat protein [Streptomyces globisporus]